MLLEVHLANVEEAEFSQFESQCRPVVCCSLAMAGTNLNMRPPSLPCTRTGAPSVSRVGMP